ncbi:MAG: hypothetical protein A2946_02315 [Candidatus Liptonbacteria bacterium RIFCSPLOWO2_01_FULL_53_13]|uniref:Uncharacterized protein n=1 Tax=Candidatus Liptonbacteria bacterium RIFCSPLOWO2_01_FULL_53_13 TaxID=1798651 RepID=A0A1G2CIS0_9BACT|nr:MAG: hypothetical protein A2946_02315 [Candidatus Liptonbacteria bacterium RIFCSPLOWO2_01_FULL_53_13]
MIEGIKAIIFDWARTLYDPDDTKKEFPESEAVLTYCRDKGLRLAVVSLLSKQYTPDTTVAMRTELIEASPLRKYFEIALVVEENKYKALDEAVARLGFPRSQILIVDDRTVRGVKYGNHRGHPTVWLQKGKFAGELPDGTTGEPTYTIHKLGELKNIL